MSICADESWTMHLVKSVTYEEVILTFRDVRVVGGVLTGTVHDSRNTRNTSVLGGTCSPFGSREDVARMSFFFRAARPNGDVVDVFMEGLGIQPAIPTEKPIFRGGFAVLPVSSPGPSLVQVGFDVGDTGTGNGMQAMFE